MKRAVAALPLAVWMGVWIATAHAGEPKEATSMRPDVWMATAVEAEGWQVAMDVGSASALRGLWAHCRAGKPVVDLLTRQAVRCQVEGPPPPRGASSHSVLFSVAPLKPPLKPTTSASPPSERLMAVYGLAPPVGPAWQPAPATTAERSALRTAMSAALPAAQQRGLRWPTSVCATAGAASPQVCLVPGPAWERPDEFASGQPHHVLVREGRSGAFRHLGELPGPVRQWVPLPGSAWPALHTGTGCDGWCEELVGVDPGRGLVPIASLGGH